MKDFITPDALATFAGLVTATGLIVQFTKSLLKIQFEDYVVRIYTFIIATILTFAFTPVEYTLQGIILTLINAGIVSLTAMGGYEVLADPYALKSNTFLWPQPLPINKQASDNGDISKEE